MLFNTRILEKGLLAQFNTAYSAMIQQPHLAASQDLYTTVPSSAHAERYAWLGDVPLVKEWIGDKTIGALRDYDYEIKNKDFYSGFSIDRNELEDEQISAINPRVQSLAAAVARWPWQLVVDLIINGTTGLAYDGTAFFANRAAPNDNLITGSGSTVANLRADLTEARAAMMRFTSDADRAMGIMMDTVVVPPELEVPMLEAIRGQSIIAVDGQGQAFNPHNGFIRNVITFPELSDTNDWYGFATGFPIRPFIFQQRSAIRPVLDDTQEARNRKLDYSVEMRGNAGYGFYQMGIKVVNT